jgi:hypothetical protein
LLKVLDMKRDAEMVGDTTCIVCGIKGAAALALTITLIGGAMQTHPHPNYLMSSLHQEGSSNGGVNTTRESDENPL